MRARLQPKTVCLLAAEPEQLPVVAVSKRYGVRLRKRHLAVKQHPPRGHGAGMYVLPRPKGQAVKPALLHRKVPRQPLSCRAPLAPADRVEPHGSHVAGRGVDRGTVACRRQRKGGTAARQFRPQHDLLCTGGLVRRARQRRRIFRVGRQRLRRAERNAFYVQLTAHALQRQPVFARRKQKQQRLRLIAGRIPHRIGGKFRQLALGRADVVARRILQKAALVGIPPRKAHILRLLIGDLAVYEQTAFRRTGKPRGRGHSRIPHRQRIQPAARQSKRPLDRPVLRGQNRLAPLDRFRPARSCSSSQSQRFSVRFFLCPRRQPGGIG